MSIQPGCKSKAGVFLVLLALFGSGTAGVSQTSDAQTERGQSAMHGESSHVPTLRTFTRMVNLELVAKDSKGHHIEELKAGDFQILEQTPDKSRKWNQQKIAVFREMHMTGMASPVSIQEQMPQGVYTNAVTLPKDPVPPTILLVDGLNTSVEHQAQVHVQMLRMLRQLPSNVPVAVFLLGDKLEMLQGFTSDPKLLQTALSKAISTANVGEAKMDPRDDPNSVGNLLGGEITPEAPLGDPMFFGIAAAAKNFDQKIFSATMEEQVDRTINALTSLCHNASGYPGRKNLLWLSTSFPITLASIGAVGAGPAEGINLPGKDAWTEFRNHSEQLRHLSAVLSDAKVAVYPVNVAGVQTLREYQSGTRRPDVTSNGISDSALRDVLMQAASVDSMLEIADDTGGVVCTGDNDLGDCVRKAVDDSSDFYEISYYSNSADWNGEFRKIAVKTAQHRTHLAYRQGYYATHEGTPGSKDESIKLQSDCEDYIDSTAIQFSAKSLPPDAQGALRFALTIDAAPITFALAPDGGHVMHLAVAACTYNEKGWTLKLMSFPADRKLDAKQFQILANTGRLSDMISVPGPRPAAVRLLVKDVPTGRLGSIYIKTADAVAAARTD